MKNYFDISDSIEISDVNIAGVACINGCVSQLGCTLQEIVIHVHVDELYCKLITSSSIKW